LEKWIHRAGKKERFFQNKADKEITLSRQMHLMLKAAECREIMDALEEEVRNRRKNVGAYRAAIADLAAKRKERKLCRAN
jgi:hypothetical protein